MNEDLRTDVCRKLLAEVGLEDCWSASGPNERAEQVLRGDGASGEARVVLGVACALWDGTGDVRVAELFGELGPELLAIVGTVLVAAAYGDEGLSDWLAAQTGSAARTPALH